MEDGFSGVLRGLGDAKEVFCSKKDIIIRAPSLDDVGCPFGTIGLFCILFYLILFYPILGHNVAQSLLYRSNIDT